MPSKVTLKFRDQVIEDDFVNLLNDEAVRKVLRQTAEKIKAVEADTVTKVAVQRKDMRAIVDGLNLICKAVTGNAGEFSFTLKQEEVTEAPF